LLPLLMPVPGFELVAPLELAPPNTPREPAPTALEPLVFAKLWLPLAKPPLLEAATPLPVPPDWPEFALVAPVTPPGALLLAATPPPVPDALPDVAYGDG
jgi:hypothetical protein